MTLLLILVALNAIFFMIAMIKENTHEMCAHGIIMLFISQVTLITGLVE